MSEPTLVQTALQCDQPIKDSALCDRLGWDIAVLDGRSRSRVMSFARADDGDYEQ